MKLQDLSIKHFAEKTASIEAMPAAGSSIALCAALSSALIEMVAKLALEKNKYVKEHERLKEISYEMNDIRLQFLEDIDRDADFYQLVLDAYQLPNDTNEEIFIRDNKIVEALKKATLVQMGIVEKGLKLLITINEISGVVLGNVEADIMVSGMICKTSVLGALLNIRTNLNEINDNQFSEEVTKKCDFIENDIENYLI